MIHKPKFLSLALSISVLAIIAYAVVSVDGGGFDLRKKASQNNNTLTTETELIKQIKDQTLALIKTAQKPAADAKKQAQTRKQIAVRLMKQNPAEFLKIAIPEKIRSGLPEEVKSEVETEISLEGEIQIIHYDNFDSKQSQTEYFLNISGNQRLQVIFAGTDNVIQPNSKIKVKGYKLDNILTVQAGPKNVEVISKANTKPPVSPEIKKVAVFLFNFTNERSEPWTTEEIKSRTFTANDSANSYYKEASNGKWALAGKVQPEGDVFGWFHLETENTGCRATEWTEMVKEQAKSQGINTDGYDYYIWAFPNSPCWAVGWAEVGGQNSWINNSYSITYKNSLVIHELGHNFGFFHASSYDCVDSENHRVTLSSTCSKAEYGDYFDVMASSHNHLSNYRKLSQGWMPERNSLKIDKTGSYDLYPSETNLRGKTQALIIPRTKNRDGITVESYYLELRKPFGVFDDFSPGDPVVNGITIRLVSTLSPFDYSYLLDANPGLGWFTNAQLAAGQMFDDVSRGIKIKTESVKPEKSAKVSINLTKPECVRAKPTVSLYPLGQWGKPGEQLWYYGNIKNNDSYGCKPATFTMNPTLLTGWTQSIDPANSFKINPEETVYFNLSVKSTTETPTGYYTFTETVTHSAGRQYSTSVAANLNIYISDSEPPQIRIYSPLNGSSVFGQVNIRAEATDNIAMGYVEFFLDNSISLDKFLSGSSDYSAYWDSTTAPDGEHTFFATAVDGSNNSAKSETITVRVENHAPVSPTPLPSKVLTPPPPTPTQTASVSATPIPTNMPTPAPIPTRKKLF